MDITEALNYYGVLDSEGFLNPPENPNITTLTQKILGFVKMQTLGLKLSEQDTENLKTMQMVFDYYNDALEDLEDDSEYIDNYNEDSEEFEDDADFIDDEDLEDDDFTDDSF